MFAARELKNKMIKKKIKMVQYYIPVDVVRNILSRLPGESQVRFMIVCKEWHSVMTDDPAFPKQPVDMLFIFGPPLCAIPLSSYVPRYRYSLRSTTTSYTTHAKNINVDTDFRDFSLRPRDFTLLPSSCNGLVLLSSIMALWSPFSRGWLQLLPPHRRCTVYGIGYDVKTDDYKVVGLRNGHKTFVYSLKSQVWREIEDIRPKVLYVVLRTGVFANNALHWIAREGNQNVVISLDLSTETYRNHLPLPSCCYHSRAFNDHTHWLSALEGCLFFICYGDCSKLCRDTVLNVWILKDCENGNDKNWHKLLTLGEKNFCGWGHWHRIYPVAYVKSKDLVVVRHEERFMWFDLKSNKCLKTVTVKGIGTLHCRVLSASHGWLSENHENGLKLDIQTSLC